MDVALRHQPVRRAAPDLLRLDLPRDGGVDAICFNVGSQVADATLLAELDREGEVHRGLLWPVAVKLQVRFASLTVGDFGRPGLGIALSPRNDDDE
jgi:hypothetical protein